jgi:NAD+ kinase
MIICADGKKSILMDAFTTIGIIGKHGDPRVAAPVAAVCAVLQGLGRTVLVETETARLLHDGAYETGDRDELGRRCQLVVVVGGDGTLLSAGRSLARAGVPILGVNQGRLGFLVDVRPNELTEALKTVFAGASMVDERPLLEARLLSASAGSSPAQLAVNDVVLRNQATIRMLDFETWLDDEFIGEHRADGMIVSTPTGSTAYALSGGGPVLHPSLDAVALVPICPHTLSDRPIVVPAGRRIRIRLRGDITGATITLDGQTSEAIAPGATVEIVRSPYRLRLLHPRGYSYFSLLRDKLHWGRSPAGQS